MSDWVDIIETPSVGWIALDAAGQVIDGVIKARKVGDVLEVQCQAVTPDGSELVGDDEKGNFEPVTAFMKIPGGILEKL